MGVEKSVFVSLLFITILLISFDEFQFIWRVNMIQNKNKNRSLRGTEVEDSSIQITALGDILLLRSMAKEIYQSNFLHLIEDIKDNWNNSDYIVANFEGVVGPIDKKGKRFETEIITDKFDENLYSNSISSGGFNYHESILSDIRDSGINILTTANNHAFDRGFEGITSTIDLLKKNSFFQIGSSKRDLERNDLSWVKFTNKNNIKTGWISCTNILCPTCRASLKASEVLVKKRILYCSEVEGILENIKKTFQNVDFIIVAPHWGTQFKDKVPESVKELAYRWLEKGVDLIIGNHPHVPQEAVKYKTLDGRTTYCLFSLGSLTSGLGSFDDKKYKQRASAVVNFKLKKSNKGSLIEPLKVFSICEVWLGQEGRKKLRRMKYTRSLPNCIREQNWILTLLNQLIYV